MAYLKFPGGKLPVNFVYDYYDYAQDEYVHSDTGCFAYIDTLEECGIEMTKEEIERKLGYKIKIVEKK